MAAYKPSDVRLIAQAADARFNGGVILLVNPPNKEVATMLHRLSGKLVIVEMNDQFYKDLREELAPDWQKPGNTRVINTPSMGYLAGVAPQSFDHIIVFDMVLDWAAVEVMMRTLKFGGKLLNVGCNLTDSRADQEFEINTTIGDRKLLVREKEAGFMIISHPRSGTHLARTALNSHPDLNVYAEVFHPACYAGHHGLPRTRDVLEAYLRYVDVGFAVHAYYGIPGGVPGYVGGRKHKYNDFWQWAPPGIRVIAMRRRNLLARFVSHTRSNKTQLWNSFDPGFVSKKAPVTINTNKLYADADYVRKVSDHVDAFYPEALVVYYEDLVDNFQYESARMQEYLGVDYEELTPTSQKIGKSLKTDIANYDEVMTYIKRHGGMQRLTQ